MLTELDTFVTILSVCSIWASKYLWETTESDGKKRENFPKNSMGKMTPNLIWLILIDFFIFQLYHGEQF